MAIIAVLFDVDGTPVDSNGAHAQAWIQAFAEFNIPPAREAARRLNVASGR